MAANFALAPQAFNATSNNITTPANDTSEKVSLSATLPVCQDGQQESSACLRALITAYAKKFGVRKQLALDIAKCESNFRSNVFGDSGKAYGTFQFHKPTFAQFEKKMGEDLDYYDTEDNIKLAVWALANNKEYHWSCYEKVTN